MTIFSKIISFLFHPLLIPLAGFYLMFNSNSALSVIEPDLKFYIYILVLFTTVLFPLMAIPVLIAFGAVKNIQMEDHRERVLPLLITAFGYAAGYFILTQVPFIDPFIRYFLLSASIAIIISALVSIKWQISIHLTGIGGLLGTLLALAFKYQVNIILPIMIIILITGLLGTARLYLAAHNGTQVLAGFSVGLITALTVLLGF